MLMALALEGIQIHSRQHLLRWDTCFKDLGIPTWVRVAPLELEETIVFIVRYALG